MLLCFLKSYLQHFKTLVYKFKTFVKRDYNKIRKTNLSTSKMKTTAAILIIFLSTLLSCQSSSKEISKVATAFYTNYTSDFREADKTLLSASLVQLIQKTEAREKAEAIKVAQSNSPTDKPLLMEGDVFTSVMST